MENDVTITPHCNNAQAEGTDRYASRYSEGAFFEKILKYGRQAGVAVIYAALLLYYLVQKPGLPWKVKLTIFGALGYFILPFDVIPDFIVGLGYADDLTVLIGVLTCCYMYIDDTVREQARAKVNEWFGEAHQGIGAVDRLMSKKSAA